MSRAQVVQDALGLTLPSDYVAFLEEYGCYEEDGQEVYGYDEEVVDRNKIPCVIGATKILRRTHPELPTTFISLYHTGMENEQVVMDTSTGQVYMITDEEKEQIAGSFEEWFSNQIVG